MIQTDMRPGYVRTYVRMMQTELATMSPTDAANSPFADRNTYRPASRPCIWKQDDVGLCILTVSTVRWVTTESGSFLRGVVPR